MATKTEDPNTSTPVVNTPIVDESSDDNDDVQGSQTESAPSVPPARHQEFTARIDVKMTSPNAQSHNVLREFCSRFTGSLRDWFESLGEYRQLQLIQTTIPIALAVIYEQFIGEPAASTEASRKEYHQMKCCSLKRHHLEMHYKRMSMLYYKLNGFNDPSLKHVFAASLPPELQPKLQRQLKAFNLDIAHVSLGKIFQLTLLCLDKICEQKDFFKDLMEHKEPFASACKKPYLKIQCKDDKTCTCPSTKKKHFQKHFHRSSSKKPKKPYRYFRKNDPSQFRTKRHNRCFICKKRGHFARNCPNKSAKVVRLIQHLQQSSILSENEEVESIFSEQSEKDDHTAFILTDLTDSDPDDIFVISTIQEINHIRPTLPGPSVKISVIPSKIHKPVSVIGFLDTGAQRNTTPPYTSISQKFLELCPENHSQFTHPSPLWKNDQFFIHLPFKLNEDVNTTKATHPGMPPSDLTLAKQECTQLLRQGAKVFSKFDLKAGFWQLGISPEDRPKTAFCIPNAHYQWTVLPFGPKTHQQLLSDFLEIMQTHGIMLSEKKSNIGKESIDFFGMTLNDGHYHPGPHITAELLKFPDTDFTKKQIQQFLGIVIYVRDFILKVAVHTSQLSCILKKTALPWGPAQTEAVKQLKKIA
ncbi:hypothetical protein KPL70_014278 [Citrus sinensis]|nr:hypothetical protein KPL70_014278 [Citrus sinensis]